MTTKHKGPQVRSGTDMHWFKLQPNVFYEGVPWFRKEGVYKGKMLSGSNSMVRLYSPKGAPEPPHIDVQSYWVTLDWK